MYIIVGGGGDVGYYLTSNLLSHGHEVLLLEKNASRQQALSEELGQAVSRLNGMEETLGRLQNDLQGTAMAMQRVEMMRQEIDALNVRFQSLQERLVYAGPVLGPAPDGTADVAAAPVAPVMAMTVDPDGAATTTVTSTTTTTAAPAGPTPLMGDMAAPANTPSATANAQMKPVVDEKKPAAPAPAAKAKAAAAASDGVRIGTHDDSVRVVLDVSGDATFTSNLDTAEKLLTVELPKNKWSGAKSETLSGNPVVASYTAQPSGNGTVLAFTLKGDTKILKTATLKNPNRVVIDLAK